MHSSPRLSIANATILALTLVIAPPVALSADPSLTFLDPESAGPDFKLQGEYSGEITLDGKTAERGMQVIALGDGKFEVVDYKGGLPGEREETEKPKRYAAKASSGKAEFKADLGTCTLTAEAIEIKDDDGKTLGRLNRTERKSPTLGAKPPEGAIVLFDGSSADAFERGKLTSDGLLQAGVVSKQKFKDFTLHVEFRTPFMPKARGQARGNSGVYLQNRYEVQILDSFGLAGKNNECGGLYSAREPKINMCFPPLSWQTYDIDFTAPRFDENGKKIKNAVATVRHNGVLIHENVELPKFTPGGESKESPTPGALMLQDHGNPVHFRNIWIVPKDG